MLFPVKGGVYADTNEYIKDHKIKRLPAPSLAAVPLVYSPFSKRTRTPSVGAVVSRYQKIGKYEDRGANHYARSPFFGKVSSLGSARLCNGTEVPALIIQKTDIENPADEPCNSGMKSIKEPYSMTAELFCDTVAVAGIRGSSPDMPLSEELRICTEKNARLTVNCFDTDPYSEAESQTSIEQWEKLLAGIRMMSSALKLSEAVLFMDARHKKIKERIIGRIGKNENIRVRFAYNKYPMNSQRLVKMLYNVSLPYGSSTAKSGYPVISATELVAAADAVLFAKPYTESVISVTGNAVKFPGNYLVRTGTSVTDLLELCGGAVTPVTKAVIGGAVSGKAVWDMSCPLYPGINSVVFFGGKEADSYDPESQCIHCGRCAEVCPIGLIPTAIAKNVKAGMYSKNLSLRVNDCIGCACCAYVCPGKEPLLQYINTAKGRLKCHV